jgi:hypothetical protein
MPLLPQLLLSYGTAIAYLICMATWNNLAPRTKNSLTESFYGGSVTKGSIKYFTLLLSGHALREEQKHENQYVSCM